jgi:hypothetical protein
LTAKAVGTRVGTALHRILPQTDAAAAILVGASFLANAGSSGS